MAASYLVLFEVAGFGSGVAGGLGLPPVRPSDWSASCHQNQPSSFGGFCEGVWSGGPHRDVLFQVYSLKGAHEMVDFFLFLVAATLKLFFKFFNFNFYFPSYPGSFRPSAAP